MILTISVSAPQSILMQVISHNDSQIFAKHCRTQTVLWDTQNTYLRAPVETELVHMASNTNFLNRDSRAPTELTDEQQKEMVHASPEVAEKQKRMQDLAAERVRSYESIHEATRRQPAIYRRYKKTFNKHCAKKRYQKKRGVEEFEN